MEILENSCDTTEIMTFTKNSRVPSKMSQHIKDLYDEENL